MPKQLGIAVVVVCLLFAVASRVAWIGRPFFNDAGLYVAIGKTVAEGGRFYADIWDTKLPGVALLMAPVYWLFGARWWCYVVLQLAMGLTSALVIARVVWRLEGTKARRHEGATFALLFGLVAFNHVGFTASGWQLETIQLFCSTLAATFFVRATEPSTSTRGRVLAAVIGGVVAGIGAMAKPTAASVLVAALFTTAFAASGLSRPDRLRILMSATAGAALVLAANVALSFIVADPASLSQTVVEIRQYASGTPWSHLLSMKTALIVLMTGLPLLVARVLSASSHDDEAGRVVWVFALAWLTLEVAGVAVQKRAYGYHFLPAFAPAALLLGRLSSNLSGRRAALVVMSLVPLLGYGFQQLDEQRRYLFTQTDPIVEIADYVRATTAPGDGVFADPLGGLVVLSDRPPGARLGMMIHFLNDDTAADRFCSRLIADLAERRPKLVVVPCDAVREARLRAWESHPILATNEARRTRFRAAWARYLSFITSHYRRETQIAGADIYRLVPHGPAD